MKLWSSLKRGATGILKLLAVLVPLGITAFFADSVVRGGADRSAAAIVTWLLPISAFVVFILRRRSPVCFGCCTAGWLYFLSPMLLIAPPLWFVYVYAFPSAWTTVNGFYRADQYWPDDYLVSDLMFAVRDPAGARLFAAAHPLWTMAFAASGGIAALCWNWGNPLYREWPPPGLLNQTSRPSSPCAVSSWQRAYARWSRCWCREAPAER